MSFQYQPRSPESWDKRSKGNLYEGYAKDQYSLYATRTENSIRILPPTWKEPKHYGLDLWLHYGVGPNNATIICLTKMRNQPCPVCKAFARAEAQGREDAKELKPTRRVLVWLIDRKEEQEKPGRVMPVLWAMPHTVDQDISKICRDRSSGELYFIDHPDQGRDVFFDKTGQGIQTKYQGYQLSTRVSGIDQKYLDYAEANPIPETLYFRTYEEVENLFEGNNAPTQDTPKASQPSETSPQPVAQYTPPPAPPAQVQAPPPAPAPAVQPFVSAWTETKCSACGEGQYTTQTGVTCSNGHANAPAMVEGNGAAVPPPPAAPKPPSRASQLKTAFTSGK